MSRLDKLKEQHPELNISIIDLIGLIDPTNTYKYCEFLIKILKNWYQDGDNHEVIQVSLGIDLFGTENIETLNDFEKHCRAKRIKNSDISTYETFSKLTKAVQLADKIVKQKEIEKQTKKLYDDGVEWLALIPLSFEASEIYGSGTKWCTTTKYHWDRYLTSHKVIYIINRVTGVKYAISKNRNDDKEISAWLADDTETSPLMIRIPKEILEIIIDDVRKDEVTEDLIRNDKTYDEWDDIKGKLDIY